MSGVLPGELDCTRGVLDVWFVIQGAPTGVLPALASSVSGETQPYIDLLSVTPTVDHNHYVYWAVWGTWYWEILFDVPWIGGMGQVYNDDATNCLGVLIFDTEILYRGAAMDLVARVEPARTEWHTEQVNSIAFLNIWRQNGVEDPNIQLPLAMPTDVIELVDGYNTELAFDDLVSALSIMAAPGIGRGRCSDYGDTVGGGGGSSVTVPDFISTVNGLAPQMGDIPIEVSASLGVKRQTGLIQIVLKS